MLLLSRWCSHVAFLVSCFSFFSSLSLSFLKRMHCHAQAQEDQDQDQDQIYRQTQHQHQYQHQHQHQPQIYKTDDNNYVLVRSELYSIPDEFTAASLAGTPIEEIPRIPDGLWNASSIAQASLPSLIKAAHNHDECLRVVIDKARTLNHIDYLVDTHLVLDIMHGALLALPDKRIFISWAGYDHLLFGFFDMEDYSVTPEVNTSISRYFQGSKLYSQQESRLVWTSKDEIMCIYTFRHSGNQAAKKWAQMYAIGKENATTKAVDFGEPIIVNWDMEHDNKNFIPIYFNDTMHLVTRFNPLTIVALTTTSPTEGLRHAEVIVNDLQPRPLPWDHKEYGHLRGGTPTVLVRGLYLGFFHTRVGGLSAGVDHYFMGAFTLSPQPPFSIQSVSNHPIVFDHSWYEGPWGGKQFSYVVYPRSILLDDDGEHLHLTIGYQDVHTYIVKLSIGGLLASLVLV